MELEREHPGVKQSMLKALGNVAPRHLARYPTQPTRPAARAAATLEAAASGPELTA